MSSETVTQSSQADTTESGETATPTADATSAQKPISDLERRLIEVSDENKKFRQAKATVKADLEKVQAELQRLREEKAAEQGKWQEMYQELKGKYEQETEIRKRDKAAFAYKTVTSQFAAEAAKAGCTRVDDLIKLASADGIISELEVSEEDFSVVPDSLKGALERAQKAYPYLYSRQTPAVRDGVPNGQKNTSASKQDLSHMKVEDLVKLAKTLPN
jgi:chromosome segregation ATPase